MNISVFNNALKAQLSKLSTDDVLGFAVDVCNRLLPHYMEFYEQTLWGNPNIISESIRLCESTKSLNNIPKSTLLNLSKQIDDIIPDTEEFADGSLALNAAASVQDLVGFAIDKNLVHILHISNYMIDTVDFATREAEVSEPLIAERISREMMHQLELTKRR